MQRGARHAGAMEQPHRGRGDQRRLLGGFGEHRIAGGERRADLPDEDGQREIPRRNADDRSQRTGALQRLPRLLRVIAAEIGGFAHFAHRIGQRLARLACGQRDQHRAFAFDEVGRALEARGALGRGNAGPRGCGGNGQIDRARDIRRGGFDDGADHVAAVAGIGDRHLSSRRRRRRIAQHRCRGEPRGHCGLSRRRARAARSRRKSRCPANSGDPGTARSAAVCADAEGRRWQARGRPDRRRGRRSPRKDRRCDSRTTCWSRSRAAGAPGRPAVFRASPPARRCGRRCPSSSWPTTWSNRLSPMPCRHWNSKSRSPRERVDGRDRERVVACELRIDRVRRGQHRLGARQIRDVRMHLAREHGVTGQAVDLGALDLGVPVGALDQPHHEAPLVPAAEIDQPVDHRAGALLVALHDEAQAVPSGERGIAGQRFQDVERQVQAVRFLRVDIEADVVAACEQRKPRDRRHQFRERRGRAARGKSADAAPTA